MMLIGILAFRHMTSFHVRCDHYKCIDKPILAHNIFHTVTRGTFFSFQQWGKRLIPDNIRGNNDLID